MNTYLRWFSRVTWLGVVLNAVFWLPALIFPGFISDLLNVAEPEFRIWLRNVGMLLVVVAIWDVAAAHAPDRWPLFAWLVPVGRAIAALFYLEVASFNTVNSSDRPQAFLVLFLIHGTLAIVTASLLQRGLPKKHQLNWSNLQRVVRNL